MTPNFTLRLLKRFLKYTVAGVATFALDLTLLATLSAFTTIPTHILVFISFLVAVSINYVLCYYIVYKGTERTRARGYMYFILFALLAALLIALGTNYLVTVYALPLLVARICVGIVSGIINFLFNTFFNFKLV